MQLRQLAAALSRSLLAPLPERLAHTAGVARAAQGLAPLFDDAERELLLAAAILHDVGYAPELAILGFHPVDGAESLTRIGLPDRLACLVAHHSGARFEAALRGLTGFLGRYRREDSLLADALTFCDLTTAPDGRPVTLDERLADIRHRHGPETLVASAVARAEPELRTACCRVEDTAADAGLYLRSARPSLR